MIRHALALLSLLAGSLACMPAPSAQTPARAPGTVFRDCADCPQMVVVPAGTFTMGAPNEDGQSIASERPQHAVTLPAFALGRTHVTRGEFARFLAASAYRPEPGCWYQPAPNIEGHGPWEQSPRRSWRRPGYAQTGRDPVVCVSYEDATAYAAWLASRTRLPYRLPSDAEWEYAARAGATATRRLGRGDVCRLENTADLSWAQAHRFRPDPEHVAMCADGHVYTAPGGRFRANAFGLHDMLGNAVHWIADCFHDTYDGAPADGSAWMEGGQQWVTGGCRFRVMRGNTWMSMLHGFRFSERGPSVADYRSYVVGFRVARALVQP